MNNAQFRKLLETPRAERPTESKNAPSTMSALGSRLRPSIPMTPRSLTSGNNEFARQLAAHRASQQPVKKFRSSAAPKGTNFGEGYTDRAKALRETDDTIEDERVRRLEALEQLAKDGHIDHEEYVRQTKLLGGDVKSTHLVKGLDFALLERVRRGENVMVEDVGKKQEEPEKEEEDLEEKLDKVLGQKVVTVERKKEKKHREIAPPLKPKTRAEILAELKRSRQAAKEAAQPHLGSKFKKFGERREGERIEDGVKVKHVVDADGKVKRKVKRSDKDRKAKVETSPPPEARVMGMMPPPPLPGVRVQLEEGEDDDIFAGAGDYDPLFALGDDDDESDTEPAKRHKLGDEASKELEPKAISPSRDAMPPPPPPSRPPVNYFNESPTDTDSDTYKLPSSASHLISSSPDIAAALAKASKLASIPTKEEVEREKRRKTLMEAHERDSYDIDMGFGGSTDFGEDDDEMVGMKGGGKKRKRGGGPKKGDKNSADVVGRIVEEKYGKRK